MLINTLIIPDGGANTVVWGMLAIEADQPHHPSLDACVRLIDTYLAGIQSGNTPDNSCLMLLVLLRACNIKVPKKAKTEAAIRAAIERKATLLRDDLSAIQAGGATDAIRQRSHERLKCWYAAVSNPLHHHLFPSIHFLEPTYS